MYQKGLTRAALVPLCASRIAGFKEPQDPFPLDEDVPAFESLGEPTPHLSPIGVPLVVEWRLRVGFGEFRIEDAPWRLRRRWRLAAIVFNRLAVDRLDKGLPPSVLFPLAFEGLAEYGLHQRPLLSLSRSVLFHGLSVQLHDQVLFITLVHVYSSSAADYTRCPGPTQRQSGLHPPPPDGSESH
jgi:hypothetical protein